MGGLSQKAHTIDKIRKNTAGRAITVDAGNPLFRLRGRYGFGSVEYISAQAVADIYTLLGFDAVAIGPNDLAGGLVLLLETADQGIPWTSANIYDHRGQRIFAPFRLKNIDDLLIAIVGLTDPATIQSKDFVIKDATAVLADLLPELAESSDLILVLAAMPIAAIMDLVEQFPRVDIVIAGDTSKGTMAPFLAGTTLVTQTGNRGRYQGVMSVSWNGQPWGKDTASSLADLRKRLKANSAQLHGLQNNPLDAASKKDKIAQLEESRTEILEQIEHLEKQQRSGLAATDVSTYENRFLPLSPSGRADPQVDYIIREAKKRMAAGGRK